MLPLWLSALAVTGADVQARMDRDAALGKPLVARVFVALADNEHQGIAKIPNRALGDGQNARTNLYWGALYGVRTYFPKQGWRIDAHVREPEGDVLERITFSKKIRRKDREVTVRVIAEAWDGRSIQKTIERFLEESAIGSAHVVAYVGHNGLMELSVQERGAKATEASSSIVLACASKPYFEERLDRAGSHPLLLTTNLMAPEAYTLEAALIAWFSGKESDRVHDVAARAYAEHQKSSVRAGKRLFWSAP